MISRNKREGRYAGVCRRKHYRDPKKYHNIKYWQDFNYLKGPSSGKALEVYLGIA